MLRRQSNGTRLSTAASNPAFPSCIVVEESAVVKLVGSMFAIVIASILSPSAHAQALLGPSPYLQSSDSPFNGVAFAYFHLENFEDGLVNTPGLAIVGGSPIGPGAFTDSVDADDGAIDGSGSSGNSYLVNLSQTVVINFDVGMLGALPTHAGVVWTDVGFASPQSGFALVTLEAFDANGVSLGTTTPVSLGDGSAFSATAEDRFLGARFGGGISRIEVTCQGSTDWEIDHVQYGRALGIYGAGCPGSGGCVPLLSATGAPSVGSTLGVELSEGLGGSGAFFAIGNQQAQLSLGHGCALLVSPLVAFVGPIFLSGTGPCEGAFSQSFVVAPSLSGSTFVLQALVPDHTAPATFSASNGLQLSIP